MKEIIKLLEHAASLKFTYPSVKGGRLEIYGSVEQFLNSVRILYRVRVLDTVCSSLSVSPPVRSRFLY